MMAGLAFHSGQGGVAAADIQGGTRRTVLYRHYDAGGALLYVGITSNPKLRFQVQRCRDAWATEIVSTSLEWHDSKFRTVCALAGMDPDFLSEAYRAGRVNRSVLKSASKIRGAA